MFKTLVAATVGLMLFAVGFSASAQDEFKPQLQKVTVNGQTLYQVGTPAGKSLDVDSSSPANIEYTFVNNGNAPASKELIVFVHFDNDGEIAVGGDYKPVTPTTEWIKGKVIVDTKAVDLSKLKGKTGSLLLGLYSEADRYDLSNEGFGDDKRLLVGSLNVK